MRKIICRLMWRIGVVTTGTWLLQGGCIRTIQQELEILLRPEGNLGLVNSSILVDLFGPGILQFW